MKKNQYLLIILIFFPLMSCEKKDSKKVIIQQQSQNDETQTNAVDSTLIEGNYPNERIEKYPELIIYPLDIYEKVENHSTGFIPLTDSYHWSDNKDSLAISDNYLGNKNSENFHILNEKYRSRFLNAMKILETDKVFIYNYSLDSIYTFQVNELPLLAHITVYGAEPPISQYDYLIGFDLQGILPTTDFDSYFNAFVYVGSENPFEKGKMKPIIWKKIHPSVFPKEVKSNNLSKLKINLLYTFQMENRDYYLLNKTHLIVLDAKTRKVISENTFFKNESASFAPLSFVNDKNKNLPVQWTGNLFKNKPPVFFGFLYESFGCISLNFIEKPENNIYIRCDNRH
ncbi:hypothetical protein HNQ02_003294 [Flavobacterium sp. 7E]|uniref:hypothetical protein n=1 Tax=Flavobacterium sp. 7E TaxID=2735898 RepID=UPI00156E4E82|nr:hypothetical protein [Flavobacterium sp. 7E]NRS90354.1 hypothetical protein [Flavobacterium sp. 7E]